MAAQLVPWSIVGLSLVVLGTLVVINPHLDAPQAAVGGDTGPASDPPPWILGVGLIGVGAGFALLAMLRQSTSR